MEITMKSLPTIVLLLLSGSVAAQCEITRVTLPGSIARVGGFRDGRITLVDGQSNILSFEPMGGAWVQTNSWHPPGGGLFLVAHGEHHGSMTVG
jgi:hypothetical protein